MSPEAASFCIKSPTFVAALVLGPKIFPKPDPTILITKRTYPDFPLV